MDISITIPNEQAEILISKHGDLAAWLKGIALSEFDNANIRTAEKAFREGILRRRPEIAKMVADEVRQEKPIRPEPTDFTVSN